MLDLFTIFTKGGIVLWYFRETQEFFAPSVNTLIRSVILQERTGINTFDHNKLTLQYKLDNEFELVFVVAFQKILKLSYVDKFLNAIHLEFRDKYKNILKNATRNYYAFEFSDEFNRVVQESIDWEKTQNKLPKQMKSFEESLKSKKTVASMIERKDNGVSNTKSISKKVVKILDTKDDEIEIEEVAINGEREIEEDVIMANRKKLAEKLAGGNKKKTPDNKKSPKPISASDKSGKKPRVWQNEGKARDLPDLERTRDRPEDIRAEQIVDSEMIGTMVGKIQDLKADDTDEENDEYSSAEEEEVVTKKTSTSLKTANKPATKQTSKVFSLFKGLVGGKTVTKDDLNVPLEKFRDHLISKNVASDIAHKLCDSVSAKLEGKVLGTFDTVASTVKTTLTESLVQILSPRRRVDILRDCLEAKKHNRPYVIAFCGVNGVGKSTNLAKICFWLIENNLSVLIAACDTFRAGAVEQLRTHMRHLNALHPAAKHDGKQMVQLYEKGYGKDAAGIAMEAIKFASDSHIDIVLVDTAGRMQDNEPLMRALAKLIKVNEPDLVLFVGEALVGNEAVDQLVKFNQALADYSSNTNPHIIDGIVLTKFDTIDDKVGAAISMTYITGQPIVFVGTGQTYTDLKALNVKAVVQALMK
jgi:signal recognition particle receptor subunit alpha